MKVGNLNQEETNQLHNLLDKACILWQYYEKEHVDSDMSNKEWEQFVSINKEVFSDGCMSVLMNDLDYEEIK
tara:strand:+ start:515 stop:730 length:216 start_codon:yes stop_codon:yes gene_type:complete